MRRFSTLGIAAAILAMTGAHQAHADMGGPAPRAVAVAPSGPLSEGKAKRAEAREPVASSAKKKKRKKKRRRRPGTGADTGPGSTTTPTPVPTTATVSGHSNWSSAQVNLQHVSGSSWVNTPGGQTLSNASGNYSHIVTAGFTYRYYVSTWFYSPFNFGGVIIQCRQLWADASSSVRTVGGGIYTGLDTFLQPTGPIGC